MSRQENTCAFCERPMETEVTVIDHSETMNLPLGEEPPERAVPVCHRHQKVIRNLPTWEDEPFPDWSEIDYGEEELSP